MKLLIQRAMGIIMMLFSFFMLLSKADVRNPEFLWMLMVCGIVFILMNESIFEKGGK